MSFPELPTPSLDEIKTWDEHSVFEHFQHPAFQLKPDHVATLRDQDTDGAALIILTENDLLRPPYNLRGGPVKKIMNEIARLKGTSGQESSMEAIARSTVEARIRNEIEIELVTKKIDQLRKERSELREKDILLLELQKEQQRGLSSNLPSGMRRDSEEIKIDKRDIFSSLDELHSKVDSLPKTILDLHEDIVPRLFFIFPEDGHWWAPSIDSLFIKTFRLYFLCEHEAIENGSTKKQFHLAYHDGYHVARPREFVAKYGAYICLILPCLSLAVRLGGHLLERVLTFGEATSTAYKAKEASIFTDYELEFCAETEKCFKMIVSNLEATDIHVKKYTTNVPRSDQIQEGSLGLIERPDLRELQAYLKGIDNSNRLGNLQRVLRRGKNGSITVRWVCKNHASEWDTTNAVQSLQTAIQNNSINGNIGFDDGTLELMIKGLLRGPLHTFRNSVAHVLSSIPLRKISFVDCKNADPEDIEAFINALSIIEILEVTYMDIKNIGITKILQKCIHLKYLDLPDCNIGYKETSLLAEALKLNTSLQNLNLERNGIDEKGASVLAEALKMHTSLQNLNLRDNNIGENGASALAEVLKVNTSLKTLNLGNFSLFSVENNFGEIGASALAEALKMNTSLQTLELGGNSISEMGASALAEALKTNTNLRNLNLKGTGIGEKGASALAEALRINSSLQTLNVGKNGIGEKGANAIAEVLKMNTSLRNLNLHDNDIGEKGASALAKALKMNTSLQKIGLGSNGIGEKGAGTLAEALKINTNLRTLNLQNNRIRENGASTLAEALKMNRSLQCLYLQYNYINDQGASELAEALKLNTSLQNLDLKCNRIYDQGASELAEALRMNTSLQTLDLENNRIYDHGAHALAEALIINTSLQNLYLQYNRIYDQGASELVEALRMNTSLQNLDLRSNNIRRKVNTNFRVLF